MTAPTIQLEIPDHCFDRIREQAKLMPVEEALAIAALTTLIPSRHTIEHRALMVLAAEVLFAMDAKDLGV